MTTKRHWKHPRYLLIIFTPLNQWSCTSPQFTAREIQSEGTSYPIWRIYFVELVYPASSETQERRSSHGNLLYFAFMFSHWKNICDLGTHQKGSPHCFMVLGCSRARSFFCTQDQFAALMSAVKITKTQFLIGLAFAGAVSQGEYQTFNKDISDYFSSFISSGQLYVPLSRVRKSIEFLILHREKQTLSITWVMHDMPVAVSKPFMKEATTFVEGCFRFVFPF